MSICCTATNAAFATLSQHLRNGRVLAQFVFGGVHVCGVLFERMSVYPWMCQADGGVLWALEDARALRGDIEAMVR